MIASEATGSSMSHAPEALNGTRYVVITPARNEGPEIEITIQGMLQQTVLPAKWIIVDDGSTDESVEILNVYAERVPWIEVVRRKDRGFRSPGGGVMEAFRDGYSVIGGFHWNFLVKLDADLTLEPDYFERCFDRFQSNPQLGVGGGTVFNETPTGRVVESNPTFHVRGATKIYRRDCWEAIGGLIPSPGWDTFDEVKAARLGWKTESFPEIMVLQRRETGANEGTWRDYAKNGRANYICGYHPLFMLLKCLKRLPQRPYFVASFALAWGYLSSSFNGTKRANDVSTIRYLRKQQLRRLLLMDSVWK